MDVNISHIEIVNISKVLGHYTNLVEKVLLAPEALSHSYDMQILKALLDCYVEAFCQFHYTKNIYLKSKIYYMNQYQFVS